MLAASRGRGELTRGLTVGPSLLALEELEADALAREVLGDAFHATFLKYKGKEWMEYCLDVTPWERAKYLRLW